MLVAAGAAGAGSALGDRAEAAAPRTLYVSPGGSDAGPGSRQRPFASIQRGVDRAQPGDTVIVADGTYARSSAAGRCGSPTVVCVWRGGRPGALITIKAEHRWRARIDGGELLANGFTFSNGAGYVRIQGFDISRLANAGGSSSGIELYDGGAGSEIVANHIHDIGRVCTESENGQVGIFVEVSDVVITRNSIHDIGRRKPDEKGCKYSSGYDGWENHDHGIYVDGSQEGISGIKIRNNIFYNVQQGWAIQVFPGTVESLSIVNNTFAFGNPHRGSSHVIIDVEQLTNARIVNNIFFSRSGGSAIEVDRDSVLTKTVFLGNSTSGRTFGIENSLGFVFGSNTTRTNPAFVRGDRPPYDFHLRATSPPRNSGLTVPELGSDFDGRARPQERRFDRGALEFVPPAAR